MIELCAHIKCPFSSAENGCTKYKSAQNCHLVPYLQKFGYPGIDGEYGYEIVTEDNTKGTLSFDRFLYVRDLNPHESISDLYAVKEIEKENIRLLSSNKIKKHETISQMGRK